MKHNGLVIRRAFYTHDGVFSMLGAWGLPVCLAHEAASPSGPRLALATALAIGEYEARRSAGGNEWAIVDRAGEPLAPFHGFDPLTEGGISLGRRIDERGGRVRLLLAAEALAALHRKLNKVDRVPVVIIN